MEGWSDVFMKLALKGSENQQKNVACLLRL